jgi:hypothetical protein
MKPSIKKLRGKQKRLIRQQRENERRRGEPECSCGVTTDEALFLSYEYGVGEYINLMQRKDGECRIDFLDNNPTLCNVRR